MPHHVSVKNPLDCVASGQFSGVDLPQALARTILRTQDAVALIYPFRQAVPKRTDHFTEFVRFKLKVLSQFIVGIIQQPLAAP